MRRNDEYIKTIEQQNLELRQKIHELEMENDFIRGEEEDLKTQVVILEETCDRLESEVETLRKKEKIGDGWGAVEIMEP